MCKVDRGRIEPLGRLLQLRDLRLGLLQPELHSHLAVHRHCDNDLLPGLLAIALSAMELAETEVTMGDERAHAAGHGERECLAIIGFGILSAAGRDDVTGEAEGVGFAAPGLQPAGERQDLPGVAGCLVNLPCCEADCPRAQKNVRRPEVKGATTEFFNPALEEGVGLVGPPGESIRGTEGDSENRRSDEIMPRVTDVDALLKDPYCEREIPTTEVREAKAEQTCRQRKGMIGRFSGPDGGLGMSYSTIELSQLGKHTGKQGLRECRRDDGRPKALGA